MKVLDLQCAHQHSFEGWFGSEDDFQSQYVRGLIECPLCGSKAVHRMPSAPRLNLGHGSASRDISAKVDAPTAPGPASGAQPPRAVTDIAVQTSREIGATPVQQAEFLKALRQVLANTEDVGDRFADEARRMHYGDAETRNIRGQASVKQTLELLDEGIEVMPLPIPAGVKETLQ
ncbi:MAG: DUF1178 family protein [Comamonadaceae bacterium]|nr:MAG: DUF1178 family protein [Comamonadaceae bacterium]